VALIFADSFDHYGLGNANILSKWTSFLSATRPPEIVSTGRCNTRCLHSGITPEGNDEGVQKGLAPSGFEGYCGFAVKFSQRAGSSDIGIFELEGKNGFPIGDWDEHFKVYLQPDNGSIYVMMGGPDNFLVPPVQHDHSAGGAVNAGIWQYLEIGWLIDAAVGWIKVRVNGVDVIDVSGIDTRGYTAVSGSGWGRMALDWIGFHIRGGGNTDVWIDDLYVCDASGGAADTFLGDVRVEALFPEAVGASAAWTPDAGNNWDRVKDTLDYIVAEPDGDLSYVESDTAHAEDTHVHTNMGAAAATIFGIQHCLYAKKLDTGMRQLAGVVRQAGVSYPSSNQPPSYDSYRYLLFPRSLHPGTGVAFTVSDINGDEYGYELTV
jgi:hypothetical protein